MVGILLAIFVGGLFAVGALLGILFEARGFGTPPGGPRPDYVVGQSLVLFVSLAGPIVLARLLYPASTGWWLKGLAVSAGVAVTVGLLGFVLAS